VGRELRADELVAELRDKADQLAWMPQTIKSLSNTEMSGELASSADLEYLHHHWQLSAAAVGPSKGLRGRLRRIAARVVFGVLRESMAEERELRAHLVRLNDALATRCDELTDAYERLLVEIDDRYREVASGLVEVATTVDHHLGRPTDGLDA
jgi:hypothetical protein